MIKYDDIDLPYFKDCIDMGMYDELIFYLINFYNLDEDTAHKEAKKIEGILRR